MHHKARFNRIAAIGFNQPAPAVFVPVCAGHFRLHERFGVQVIFFGNHMAIIQRFRRIGIFLLRGELGFFQQGKIHIGLDIARGTGIAVPVPCTAKIAAFFDNAEIINTGLTQARRSQHAAEATPDNRHINFVIDRPALQRRIDIRVIHKIGEIAHNLAILVIAIIAHTLVALGFIFLPQGVRIKPDFLFLHRHFFS